MAAVLFGVWLRFVVSQKQRARQFFWRAPLKKSDEPLCVGIGSVDQARTPAGPCEQRHHHTATAAAPAGAVTKVPKRVQG